FYLTSDLVVSFESFDSITLILFVSIYIETAVNSICLGTCLLIIFASFSHRGVFLEAGAKVQLLFFLASFFLKFF
ncbi:hypothetical protein, partial [Flavobacterium glycines]|uniref:hypothetical protein n=1 Tax=Flavobacterium glycines TaxID=551990 RepID=UPI001C3F855E